MFAWDGLVFAEKMLGTFNRDWMVLLAMEDVLVEEVMSSPVRTVHHSAKMKTAAEKMQAYNIGSVIVTGKHGEYLGILTATDCIDAIADDVKTVDVPVNQYLTTSIATATGDDEIQSVADKMMENQVHHVPVVDDNNKVVGIVTTTDATAYISRVYKPTPDIN